MVLRAGGSCPKPGLGAKSGRLALDMTEQQVMSAVGYRPNKVEMKTCGERAPHGPWTCKIYTFGGPLDSDLIVYFAVAKDGVWVVNGWDVYP